MFEWKLSGVGLQHPTYCPVVVDHCEVIRLFFIQLDYFHVAVSSLSLSLAHVYTVKRALM